MFGLGKAKEEPKVEEKPPPQDIQPKFLERLESQDMVTTSFMFSFSSPDKSGLTERKIYFIQQKFNSILETLLIQLLKSPVWKRRNLHQARMTQDQLESFIGESIFSSSLRNWQAHLKSQHYQEVSEIEEGKIVIRILNKGFLKDDTIGVYELEFTQIYFQKDHVMQHQWLALSNPEGKDFNEITGYLKLSISIAGPGDDQVQLTDDPSGLDKTDGDSILMPASIKKQYKQLYFRILRAEKLPKMDRFGYINPYIQTTFFKQTLRTKTIESKDGVIQWDEEIWLPIQWPVASNRLVFKLYDSDPTGDDLVGSMIFSIKSILQCEKPTFNWVNIYGAPVGYSGENTDKMNNNPEYASTWKGRVLVQYFAEDTKNPELKIKEIGNEVKQEQKSWQSLTDFEIMCEIGSAICLPKSEKYKVKLTINDFSLMTEAPLETKQNYCRWNKRFDLTTLTCSYRSIEDLERVYIYLMDGDKPVCYWKGDAKDFQEPDPGFKWLPLTSDLSVGEVSDNSKAGMIQIKLCINHKSMNGAVDFKKYDSWKKPPPKRLSAWKIRAYIYQCKDLPAADDDGTSDPYIEVWSPDKNRQLTPVVEDNCNPIFFSTLEIYYDFLTADDSPPIVLNIWDQDTSAFDSDDFLGRAVIFLKDASLSQDDSITIPKWHKIQMGFHEDEPSIGEVLCSFALVRDDYNFIVPLSYMRLTDKIDFKEFTVEINALGLRGLQSFGLVPVKKPFIKFNLRSLLPPEQAKAITNVKTNPGDTGPNPNINTTVTFTITLPSDPLFCPKLSCDVFDYVFKGLSQPLLGTFAIPIGPILEETKNNQESEIIQSDYIIRELKKVLNGGVSAPEEELKADPNQIEFQIDTNKANNSSPQRFSKPQAKVGGAILQKGKKLLQDALQAKIRNSYLQNKMEIEQKQKRELEEQRLKDLESIKQRGGGQAYKNVIIPKYAIDERLKIQREVEPPPPSLFVGLGFNQKPEDNKKHYRRYYPDELENIKEVMPKKPFHEDPVMRGQQRGLSKGFFGNLFGRANTDETGQVSNLKQVGKFKGLIKVYNKDDDDNYKALRNSRNDLILRLIKDVYKKVKKEDMTFDFEKIETQEGRNKFNAIMDDIGLAHLNLASYLIETSYEDNLAKLMLTKTKTLVRLYMVEGFDFAQRDIGSYSDPYLKISLGKKTFNERDNYQLDQPNPKFYKYYDFDAEFPGAQPLVIQAYDYDDLFGDDMIGETVIDLDDRFFSAEWQSIKEKPVEYRSLSHPSSTVGQGVVKCWVEIYPTSKASQEQKPWDITPRPQKDYEVRVVVWDTKDVIPADWEGVSDIFIRGFFDTKNAKESDTHYRCQNGAASFNYRILYTVSAPCDNYNFTVQVWDRDFFASNDLIGDANLDLKPLFTDVIETEKSFSLNKKYYESYLKDIMPKDVPLKFEDEDSFWVPVKGKDEKTNEIVVNGFVRLSLTVMAKEQAELNKVGDARSEPNHSPFLPPPQGRLEFSFNPFKMLSQLIGPELKRKIIGYGCLIICCILIVSMLPLIFSNLLSQAILKAF